MRLDCGPCVVRTTLPADAEQLSEIAADWAVARFMRDLFPHPYSIDDAHAWIARNNREDATHFLIEADGRPAGGIGYVLREAEERCTAEFGYWLGRQFWGRGLATAAARCVAALTFERHPELERLEARVYATNPASMRVLEKCGFEREGVLRRSIVKGGKVLDAMLYARLRG